MAKYTIKNGPTKPAAHFSKTLGRKVNESTVKSIKKHFLASLGKSTEQRLPYSPRAEVRRENHQSIRRARAWHIGFTVEAKNTVYFLCL